MPSYGGSSERPSTVETASEEAANVAGTAVEEGEHVVEVAKEQAADVADEARYQAKDLLRQTQDSLREQAAQQQERVAAGLESVGAELSQMAQASTSHGAASDLVRQAADRVHTVASWLGERDPGSLLREVRSYASRNPGTFIAVAAVAGVVAGRLTRSLAQGSADSAGSSSDRGQAGGGALADPMAATTESSRSAPSLGATGGTAYSGGSPSSGGSGYPAGSAVIGPQPAGGEPMVEPGYDSAAGERR